jgi:hypothetical protein
MLYYQLKKFKFWHSKDGAIRIRIIPMIDFLPYKGHPDYIKSLPEDRAQALLTKKLEAKRIASLSTET